MDKMEAMSIMAAAQKMKTTQEEVKRLMKSGVLEVVDRENDLPGVSERSVLDFIGEARGDLPKKRGRKPRLWTIEDAAFYLDCEESEVAALVEKGELEFYEADLLRETDVKMYKKKKEGREAYVAPENEEKDTDTKTAESDMPRHTDAHSQTPDSTQEDKPQTERENKDQDGRAREREDGSENVFDIDAVMQELFPGIRRLDGSLRKAALAANEKRYTLPEIREAASLAYMRGKLAVYESLKSFERR